MVAQINFWVRLFVILFKGQPPDKAVVTQLVEKERSYRRIYRYCWRGRSRAWRVVNPRQQVTVGQQAIASSVSLSKTKEPGVNGSWSSTTEGTDANFAPKNEIEKFFVLPDGIYGQSILCALLKSSRLPCNELIVTHSTPFFYSLSMPFLSHIHTIKKKGLLIRGRVSRIVQCFVFLQTQPLGYKAIY